MKSHYKSDFHFPQPRVYLNVSSTQLDCSLLLGKEGREKSKRGKKDQLDGGPGSEHIVE
jgi:hypothetical protein